MVTCTYFIYFILFCFERERVCMSTWAGEGQGQEGQRIQSISFLNNNFTLELSCIWRDGKLGEESGDLGSFPGFAPNQLCDLEQITSPRWALVFSFEK